MCRSVRLVRVMVSGSVCFYILLLFSPSIDAYPEAGGNQHVEVFTRCAAPATT